jgi:prolyl oligopeptidase
LAPGEFDLRHAKVIVAEDDGTAARLQAATLSGRPVYLRTSTDSGHGHGSALSVRIDLAADYLSFLYGQLGMSLQAATQ